MRSFKKIAAMILAVAMLCSFTALGATVNLDNVALSDGEPSIVLNYDSTATQTSILVYEGTVLTDADVVYIDQLGKDATKPEVALPGFGTYTVVAGGMDVPTAVSKEIKYEPITHNVTITGAGTNGYVTPSYTGDLEKVEDGAEIKFYFGPFLGYQVASVTVNGSAQSVAPAGGNITVTVNSDVEIAVTWAEIPSAEGEAFTSAEIYDIPVDLDAAEEKDQAESKLVFGKVTNRAGAEPIEVGMYLQKKVAGTENDWEDALTSKGLGPWYAADKEYQSLYGIRFFSFGAGEYKVQSYAKYDDAEDPYDYGAEIVFTVN